MWITVPSKSQNGVSLAAPRIQNFKAYVRVSDPWFEVYKVTPGVFAIYEPQQSEETISYLILGKEKALLFDTGMGISDIRNSSANSRSSPSSSSIHTLTMITLAGTGNSTPSSAWTLTSPAPTQRVHARTHRPRLPSVEVCGNLPQIFDGVITSPILGTSPRYIHGGEKIDLGGRTIEILSTPGHTPDAITLLDRTNGLLFTGDTYYPAPIWLYRPETDFDAYTASIQRLAALAPQIKLVLGAHNIPVAPPSILPRW